MPAYSAVLSYANTFEGMMGTLDIAIWDALLSYQASLNILGDCIEFGVYRGKSASVIAHHVASNESLILVESADYPQLEKLQAIGANLRLFKQRSEDFLASFASAELGNVPKIRFSHHDASHYFSNVTAELDGITPFLNDGAVVVLDDFGYHYSQVIAAYFYQRFVKCSELELFLISRNKGYLCRSKDFRTYEDYVLNCLLSHLRDRHLECYIARTDVSAHHRALHVAPKRQPDMPDRYGLNFWGDKFYGIT